MLTLEKIKQNLQNKSTTPSIEDQAAVLIPIVNIDGQLNLLFQVRSDKVSWQPGDICFPGGRMETEDNTVIDCAFRETVEELGVNQDAIKIYGQLPAFLSPLGLKIYPVVGELTSLKFNLNLDEVADTFTVPIDWFIHNPPLKATMEVAHKPSADFPFDLLPQRSKEWQKRSQHELYFYHYQQHVIWGLTAQIVQLFLKRVYFEDAPKNLIY